MAKRRIAVTDERTEVPALASRTPLTESAREVLHTQTSPARLRDLGAETRSALVLNDARGWITPMQKTMEAPPEGLFYGQERFTYFLEVVNDLRVKIEIKTETQQDAARARGVSEVLLARARRVRTRLVSALSAVARGHELLENELNIARGQANTEAEINTSLQSLLTLARAWLTREPIRARIAMLTAAQVDEAQTTQRAFALAIGERREEGHANVRDDADTNLAEGRVLTEMRAAMRAFADAKEEGANVPSLTPGAATRRVLMGHKEKAKKPPS